MQNAKFKAMQNAKFKAMQYAKNFELELEKMHLDA